MSEQENNKNEQTALFAYEGRTGSPLRHHFRMLDDDKKPTSTYIAPKKKPLPATIGDIFEIPGDGSSWTSSLGTFVGQVDYDIRSGWVAERRAEEQARKVKTQARKRAEDTSLNHSIENLRRAYFQARPAERTAFLGWMMSEITNYKKA